MQTKGTAGRARGDCSLVSPSRSEAKLNVVSVSVISRRHQKLSARRDGAQAILYVVLVENLLAVCPLFSEVAVLIVNVLDLVSCLRVLLTDYLIVLVIGYGDRSFFAAERNGYPVSCCVAFLSEEPSGDSLTKRTAASEGELEQQIMALSLCKNGLFYAML